MEKKIEKIPDQKEIEKEIGEFLNKKFGGNVKIISPSIRPQKDKSEKSKTTKINDEKSDKIYFDLKPEELVAYLDQYIVKQDEAKKILATKVCTHFNRIKYFQNSEDDNEIIGNIKSNILMIGPTGVGKTYMIKLIAKKLGVPFVKGDATKFTEAGYVGGDIEDLIRDLVREADDNIELAQNGIIYIDEIDKIASSNNFRGADISRTGVQRALLKPMEDTDVELKIPHDPVSMLQEMERFQKSGKSEKRVVNTGNILFIMSGAFSDITDIVKNRLSSQTIGFGSEVKNQRKDTDYLKEIKTEDLVKFGFESEFVGRLPVKAVFETLSEEDLYEILKTPNNPVILSKKLDFAAYYISIKFDDKALKTFAKRAYSESTGARGIVSALEEALLPFESKLPSSSVKKFPVTKDVVNDPELSLKAFIEESESNYINELFEEMTFNEKKYIKKYIESNWKSLSLKYKFTLTQYRIDYVVDYFCNHATTIGNSIKKISSYFDVVKLIEEDFFENNGISIYFEDDAIDFIIEQFIEEKATSDEILLKITTDFEHGLKLASARINKVRFSIPKESLLDPESFLSSLLLGNQSAKKGSDDVKELN